MGYDLEASNKKAGWFHFGAFSFPVLLEACGYLWPCIQNGGQWYCAFGVDKRMPDGDTYPTLISNDGFRVTAEEAHIMARIARNFVVIQRSLPDSDKTADARSKSSFNKEDVMQLLGRTMFGGEKQWPVKIRDDFVGRFEQFADWAEGSRGFKIH